MKKITITISVIIMIILVGAIILNKNETYSLPTDVIDITEEVKNGTISEETLIDYAVATAKHYFYKRTITDYEQNAMDDGQNAGGYPTFNFRNFRNEPEELHKGNYVNFDCSSFATNIYLNSFGYFFGDYYNATYTNLFDSDYNRDDAINYNPDATSATKPSFVSVGVNPGAKNFKFNFETDKATYTRGSKTMSDFYNITLRAGKNTKMFPLATSVIEKEIEMKGITEGYSNPPKKGVIYNGSSNDNIKNGLITFYYYFTGDETEEKKQNIWTSFLNVLQDGDIFMQRTCSNGSCAGHVMFYTKQRIQYVTGTTEQGFNNFGPNKDYFGKNTTAYFIDSTKLGDGGFIHASGNDYSFDSNESSILGIDDNSIRYTSLAEFGGYELDENGNISSVINFDKSYLFKKNITAITIFRPINEIKNANYTNFYNFDTSNEKATKGKIYISKNTIARSELADLRISENVRKVDDNGNFTSNYLSEYNSVNVGDNLHYRLCLENMTYKTNTYDGITYTINISDTLPENTRFVRCKSTNGSDCTYDKDTRTIKWTNFELAPRDGTVSVNNISTSLCSNYVGYTVEIENTDDDNILSNTGMKVNKVNENGNVSENTLTMSTLNLHVVPTVDNNKDHTYANKFTTIGTAINEAITNEKISIVTNEANITSSSSFKNTIDDINNSSSTIKMLPAQVIKLLYYNVFDGINIGNIGYYAEGNSSGNNNVFKKFVDSGDYTNYTIRLSYESSNTNGKMLIPGLYGGRKVRGNLDLKRESIIKINYLQVGDLILSTEDDETKNYWIYLGKNEDGYDKMLFFNNSTNNLSITVDASDNLETTILFNEIYRKRTYAILRPNSTLLSKVNYIMGSNNDVVSTEFKSIGTTYKALPDYTTLQDFAIEDATITYNYNNLIEADNYSVNVESETTWYTSNNFSNTTKVTANSLVGGDNKSKFYNLYGKNTYKSVILPLIEKEKYTCNWNTKVDGTGENYNPGDSYNVIENITLYAICNYHMTIDSNSINIDNDNSILYNIEINTRFNDLIEQLNTNALELTFMDNEKNELSENQIIKTGDIIKFIGDGSSKEYELAIAGDIARDGIINVGDVAKLYQYVKGKNTMAKVYQIAGNVTEDEFVNIADVAKLYQYIKGKIESLK